MDNIPLYIESLIFSATKPITLKEVKQVMESHFDTKFKEKDLIKHLESLTAKYADEQYPFDIKEIAGGFQFMTKGTYHPLISHFLRLESKKKISRAALETLSIIAYKQPVTKSGMEGIRGVNCDYSVQKLLEKELIEIRGRAEGPGRPLLYGVTDKFMDHFGLKSLKDLPKIQEFAIPENTVGVQADDLPEPNPVIDGSIEKPMAAVEGETHYQQLPSDEEE